MRPWPDRLLHEALHAEGEPLRRARLTVLLAVPLVGTGLAYAAFYGLVVGYRAGAAILVGGAALAAVAVGVLRLRPWVRTVGHMVTGVVFGVVVGLTVCEGGIRALAAPLFAVPPIVAILLLGRRSAIGWTALCLLTLVAFGVADARGIVFPLRYPAAWTARMNVGSPIGLVLCTALLILTFESMRAEAQRRADEAGAALARLAYQDALTGLANRARFMEQLHAALGRARAAGDAGRLAVLLLDLDGFKAVNDTLGHAAGDALLVEVGARLLSATRGCDTVARLGGDEFAVLVDGVHHDADAARVAERVVASLGRPFALGAGAAHVGASVGVARARAAADDAAAAATLLHEADVALYRAKAQGRGRWLPFEPAMLDQEAVPAAPAVPPLWTGIPRTAA